jgi:type II secretory pathway pseudopilin PulG
MSLRARLVSEEGVTLVEILVTVMILGVAFVTLVGGMSSAMIASDIHRKEATAGAALRSYAEAIKGAGYTNCATPATYAPASVGYVQPAASTAGVTSVEYWQVDSSDPNTGSFNGTCTTDQGLQRISVQVTTSDGRATESVQILKRTP